MTGSSHPPDRAPSDRGLDARIRARAHKMWEAAGKPKGQDAEFWERARELQAIADNPGAGQLPNPLTVGDGKPHPVVDEAALQDNLGEFPSLFTDQGDREVTPHAKDKS